MNLLLRSKSKGHSLLAELSKSMILLGIINKEQVPVMSSETLGIESYFLMFFESLMSEKIENPKQIEFVQ